jgi:hypothetical protein
MKSSRLKKNSHRPTMLTVMNSSVIRLPARSQASPHLPLPEEKAAATVVAATLQDSPLAVNPEAHLRKAVASQASKALMRNSAFSKLVTQ